MHMASMALLNVSAAGASVVRACVYACCRAAWAPSRTRNEHPSNLLRLILLVDCCTAPHRTALQLHHTVPYRNYILHSVCAFGTGNTLLLVRLRGVSAAQSEHYYLVHTPYVRRRRRPRRTNCVENKHLGATYLDSFIHLGRRIVC